MDKGMSSLEELDALILAYRQELSEDPQSQAVQLNLQSLMKLRQSFRAQSLATDLPSSEKTLKQK
jgi:hypothetical protein